MEQMTLFDDRERNVPLASRLRPDRLRILWDRSIFSARGRCFVRL